MTEDSIQPILTADGSFTLYLPGKDETYHSVHGAETESDHVFIRQGLYESGKSDINVLEVGFGTGLNALLSMLFSKKEQVKVIYTSIELYPLSEEIYLNLNYGAKDGVKEEFLWMHLCEWEEKKEIVPGFDLVKRQGDFREMDLPKNFFDVVFFDAFAPRVQPELWTPDVFHQMYDAMAPGAILVTYCAKGDVKRNLKAVGFLVETLPGPPGKREMTRARRPKA